MTRKTSCSFPSTKGCVQPGPGRLGLVQGPQHCSGGTMWRLHTSCWRHGGPLAGQTGLGFAAQSPPHLPRQLSARLLVPRRTHSRATRRRTSRAWELQEETCCGSFTPASATRRRQVGWYEAARPGTVVPKPVDGGACDASGRPLNLARPALPQSLALLTVPEPPWLKCRARAQACQGGGC